MNSAINSAAARLAEVLTKANADRLNQLLALADDQGRLNLARALETLYPTLYKRDPKRAQTALRKYRQLLAEAATDAGIEFAIESDRQTRAKPNQRHLTLRAATTTAPRVNREAIAAEVAPPPGGTVHSTGIPLDDERPLFRYFVISAQTDRPLKKRLLKWLQPLLASHKEARFHLASPIEVTPTGRYRETAPAEIEACDFGLLLIGPSLLATRFIQDRNAELADRAIPVALAATPRAPHDAEDPAFSQLKHDVQEAFALHLLAQIDRRIRKPAPATSALATRAAAMRETARALSADPFEFIPTAGTPLGDLEKLAITPIPQDPKYREDAIDYFLRWLTNPNASPWAALLGEYGMGKTTTAKALAREILKRRDEGQSLPTPIYLDLRAVGADARTGLTLEQILDLVLSRTWKSGPSAPRQAAETILAQVRNEGALIIWDGLDEVLVHLDPASGQQFTRQLYRILPPRTAEAPPDAPTSPSRMLVTCRTHYFRTLREQKTHFMGEGREDLRPGQYAAFLLLRFDESQIRQYIAQTLPGHNVDRVMETISAIHNLRELAERPFTLSLIAREFEGIERLKAEGRPVTGVTLYRHMALSWLERDSGKHHFTPDHKQALMEQIAAELWRSGARQWRIADLENWLIAFLAARPDLAAHYPRETPELLKEDLRTATFLVRDESDPGDRFRFAHTSLQEFFLAGYLRRALVEGKPDLWDLPAVSPETLEFLGQWLLEEPDSAPALSTLAKLRDAYRPRASELAFAYVLLAKRKAYPAPSPAGFQLAGANLTGLEIRGAEGAPLALARANFRGAKLWNTQWRYCNLDGADLSGAVVDRAEFLNCYLANSQWRGASLEAALFRDCRCGGAEFEGSRRHRARFIRCAAMPADVPSRPAQLNIAQAHTAWVNGCAWSPDGTRVLSASDDYTLRIWDAASGDSLVTFQGHSNSVKGCAWSPDGTRVLSASDDNTLRIWDAASGRSLLTLQGHSNSVNGCAWSPDSTRVLSASFDNTLRIWDAASGRSLLTLQGHADSVNGCAWSPDGARVLSASYDNTLRIWDAASGDSLLTLQGHSNPVKGCAWSPDGARVLSASEANTLRIWDAASGDSLLTLQGHSNPVKGCAWSPDGARVLSASEDNTLRIWDAASGDSLLTLQGHSIWVNGCAWSPDGTRVLSASYDNTLHIWDAASGRSLLTLKGHSIWPTGCAWSPDGTRVLSASSDNALQIWDAATGRSLLTLQGHSSFVYDCAWSPDGTRVLSASWDNTRIWDAASGRSLLTLQGHSNWVTGCAWSPDGTRVLSASWDKTLRIWDAASGDSLLTLQGHAQPVTGCAWSPDGARVLSASTDDTLRIWDAASGRSLLTLQGHSRSVNGCAWSPDGTRVLSASLDSTLRIWDAAGGRSLLTLQGHSRPVNGCAWSPDATRVLSASWDNTLRIWDAAGGRSLLTLEGHSGSVNGCAWSPDGKRVLSASRDNTLRIWDAAGGRELAPTLCQFQDPRTDSPGGVDWAALDFPNNRILACSPGAWRALRWITTGDATHPPEAFPAEIFGPLPG